MPPKLEIPPPAENPVTRNGQEWSGTELESKRLLSFTLKDHFSVIFSHFISQAFLQMHSTKQCYSWQLARNLENKMFCYVWEKLIRKTNLEFCLVELSTNHANV